jgi:hypothetical protein
MLDVQCSMFIFISVHTSPSPVFLIFPIRRSMLDVGRSSFSLPIPLFPSLPISNPPPVSYSLHHVMRSFLCFLIQHSLRGVGPNGPYGFRLVDRAYSSERPEAEFPIPPSAPPSPMLPPFLIPHSAIHNPKSKDLPIPQSCFLPTFSSSQPLSFHLPLFLHPFAFKIRCWTFDVHLFSSFPIPHSVIHNPWPRPAI